MFHDGILFKCSALQVYPALLDVVLFLYCCLVVVPVVAGHFHVVNIQGRAPENEERKKRDTSGEKHHGPRNRIISTKKLFSPRDGEKTFSFFGFFFWISVEDFVDLMKARKNLFQMGKLGRVLFVFLIESTVANFLVCIC
jgi:hypothetical protein